MEVGGEEDKEGVGVMLRWGRPEWVDVGGGDGEALYKEGEGKNCERKKA